MGLYYLNEISFWKNPVEKETAIERNQSLVWRVFRFELSADPSLSRLVVRPCVSV